MQREVVLEPDVVHREARRRPGEQAATEALQKGAVGLAIDDAISVSNVLITPCDELGPVSGTLRTVRLESGQASWASYVIDTLMECDSWLEQSPDW